MYVNRLTEDYGDEGREAVGELLRRGEQIGAFDQPVRVDFVSRPAARTYTGVMAEAVIISAVRTPVGRHGGALSDVRPDDLAAVAIREAVERAGVRAGEIEDVYFGCAPTRPARTTATSRGWRRSSPGCPKTWPASRSTGSARPG